jgi:hypothetical protein
MDSFFEDMDAIFKHLNTKKTGKQIKTSELLEAVGKLADKQETMGVVVPTPEDIEAALDGVDFVPRTEGMLEHEEFLKVLFYCMTKGGGSESDSD